MLLSVIIPTYKRNDLLSLCLEALQPSSQTIDSQYYEVIVTDDSPNYEAKSLVENTFPWAKWKEGPHRGPAANRNNGAKFSRGEWIVFIDDDCIPDKMILQTYYNAILKGNYDAFEGLINADRPQERFDEESPLNLEGGCFWSCNIAVSKNMFDLLEGFDEGFPFPAMEDVDFHERLKKVARLKFLESAKVIHPWRRVKPFKSYKKRIASHQYLIKKNNIKKNLNFRFKRIKIFVSVFIKHTKLLYKYSFKGVGVYFETLWSRILMIFV
ncbi:MAG: glycosyltransferase [Leeuwenhoekiella sp.]